MELNSVINGLHTLFIRAKDGNGKWSFPSHQLFSKEIDSAAISRIEYFYVKDATITETYEFTDFTPSLNLETNFSAYLPDLDVGSDYNLVIKAYDQNGLPSLLNTHQFTVTPSPLAAPVLNSPLNLSQNQQPNLNFSWFNSLPSEQILQKKSNKEKKNLPREKTSFRIENFDGPDADTITYRIQLASDVNFYDVVFDDSTLTDTTNNISSLENDSTFYWRVRGYSSSLGKGDWSEKRSFSTISPIKLNVKAFLEGPYNLISGVMDTSLSNENRLPKFQPFNLPAYSYNGTEQVDTIPTSIIDWVLVELRENLFSNSVVKRKAGFINKFGEVVDLGGKNNLKLEKTNEGNYYAVIW